MTVSIGGTLAFLVAVGAAASVFTSSAWGVAAAKSSGVPDACKVVSAAAVAAAFGQPVVSTEKGGSSSTESRCLHELDELSGLSIRVRNEPSAKEARSSVDILKPDGQKVRGVGDYALYRPPSQEGNTTSFQQFSAHDGKLFVGITGGRAVPKADGSRGSDLIADKDALVKLMKKVFKSQQR